MRANAKPRWRKLPEILCALRDVVDATAAFAVKMMMMPHVGPFVANRLTGDLDGFDEAVLQKTVDRTVDGGHADAVDFTRRGLEQLLHAEWPVRARDDVAQGVSLPGLAGTLGFHGANILQSRQVAPGRLTKQ